MTPLETIAVVSLVLNMLGLMGLLLGPIIYKLVDKNRAWIVGLGSVPEVRKRRIKSDALVVKKGAKEGDLHLVPQLVRVATDGRQVVFWDREHCQQIAPVPGQKKQRLLFAQHAGFLGQCVDDGTDDVWVQYDGENVSIGLVWKRITGYYLNQKRKSTNIDKINGGDVGLFGFLQAAMPFLMILSIIILITIAVMVGGLA